jgi:hypothetical protein
METSRVAGVSRAIADGRLRAPVSWLKQVDAAPADVAGVLALSERGHCIFHGEGCAIHSALGHAAMPAACQHFPRVVLIDPRGVFVTLSHYCPTAAAMLLEDNRPVSIVDGPAALPGDAMPEGLDARDAWPPLRSPRLLMDLDEYGAWERDIVDRLTRSDAPESVLDELLEDFPSIDDEELCDLARECVPAPYSWTPAPDTSHSPVSIPSRVVSRFVAAHAFACWMAYQGNGLVSIAIYLRLVLAVLRAECRRQQTALVAIRQSDLLLRHLIDREALANRIKGLGIAHDRSS